MTKRNKMIYWATTGFLAFGMTAQGVTQIAHAKGFTDMMAHLGYPLYLLYIIGAWKLLGVVAILIPRYGLLKEWAYAGFFFVMSGALFSHIALGDGISELAPSIVLMIIIVTSWYFRPADRKVVSAGQ